ncbi:hypothetical protein [Pandoraea oxalativorans]|uniref:Uncharacterized protein n=1 Tax=Pandoraea oxalativorans TaxID=573737 RepID=A0A0G3IFF6_9BURK|nr:hypothetical protein [Pandoraea oxalativorans]AKK24646.1 hypothetical protein MB84_27805 [Pandoraea oxalativorans]
MNRKKAVALYAGAAGSYACASKKKNAAVILGNLKNKFEDLKQAYESFLANHRICEALGVVNELTGHSIDTCRNEFEYYLNKIKESFEKNSIELIQHTKCLSPNREILKKEKIEYNNRKNELEAAIKQHAHSYHNTNVIHITEIEDAMSDIKNKISDMAYAHKHLNAIYTLSGGLNDRDMDVLEKNHHQLLSISNQYLIRLENIIFFAKT